LTVLGNITGVLDGVDVTKFQARDQHGDVDVYLIDEALILKGTVEMDGHPDLMVGNLNGMNCVVRIDGRVTTLVVAHGDQRTFENLASVIAKIKTQ
jgi:hypothetical protein